VSVDGWCSMVDQRTGRVKPYSAYGTKRRRKPGTFVVTEPTMFGAWRSASRLVQHKTTVRVRNIRRFPRLFAPENVPYVAAIDVMLAETGNGSRPRPAAELCPIGLSLLCCTNVYLQQSDQRNKNMLTTGKSGWESRVELVLQWIHWKHGWLQ
jgi:hypothetical protein